MYIAIVHSCIQKCIVLISTRPILSVLFFHRAKILHNDCKASKLTHSQYSSHSIAMNSTVNKWLRYGIPFRNFVTNKYIYAVELFRVFEGKYFQREKNENNIMSVKLHVHSLFIWYGWDVYVDGKFLELNDEKHFFPSFHPEQFSSEFEDRTNRKVKTDLPRLTYMNDSMTSTKNADQFPHMTSKRGWKSFKIIFILTCTRITRMTLFLPVFVLRFGPRN